MHNTTSPQTDDNAIEQEIKNKGLTAPRVTPDRIDALIARVQFRFHVEETSTFCHAFLDGEFFLATGHSACVSKTNFDWELGQKIAKENVLKPARDKLWELEGYALRERMAAEALDARDLSMSHALQLPDGQLGRLVKHWAKKIEEFSETLGRLPNLSAALILVQLAAESNAGHLGMTLEGCTFGDEVGGDWRLTIDRVSA